MPWREIKHQNEYWAFVQHLPYQPGIFLQTPDWAAFLNRLGLATKLLVFELQGQIIAAALLARHRLPGGFFYWFCPKGPLWLEGRDNETNLKVWQELLLSQRAGALFIRLEPPRSFLDFVNHHIKVVRVPDVNPRATVVVDLKPPFENILSAMHEKTRYNFRLAERKGLQFRWGSLADFEAFWHLLQTTARREKFHTHPPQHYKIMLELLGGNDLTASHLAARLALVELNRQLLAAGLILIYRRQAVYLHGASGREHRELMAPYLLHGVAMRELRAAGCESYDFWGVQPQDGSLPSWAGFSRFKMGWGGRYFESPGTFDYPLRPVYYLIYKYARCWVHLCKR